MAARSIWNGNLSVGSKTIPVHLYSAVQDRSIHFHLLDAQTKHRVKQHMVNPNSGKEVAADEVRKGFETESGEVIFLDKEEIASIQPKPSRDIDVSEFLPLGGIAHQWYERRYWLCPAEEDKSYFALAAALAKQEREGLARWVMRDKEYFGSLRERDGYLVLVTLRYAEEVVSARDLPRPAGREPDPREIGMAEQLIGVLADDFRPEDFRDEYRDRVMKLIEQKAKGQKPKLATIPKRKAPPSLLDALQASLRSTKSSGGKRVA
jgi:DNA end-binding protein Ku